MALQRNLKALGTFGYQTSVRRNPVYIQYIPRTIRHVAEEPRAAMPDSAGCASCWRRCMDGAALGDEIRAVLSAGASCGASRC